MPEQAEIKHVRASLHDKDSIAVLFVLLICTSILLTVTNSVLAWKLDVTLTAIKSLMLVLSVYGAAGMMYRVTNNLCIVAITMVVYMLIALRVGSQWLELPLIIMSIVYYPSAIGELEKIALPKTSVLLASVLATLLISGATQYANFQIMDYVHAAKAHADTLFHASIASMIKQYHMPSTGLHGLIEISYHVLSHRVLAAFSVLGGVSVLEAYGFIQIIFLNPLLIFSLAYAAAMLLARHSTEKAVSCWSVVCGFLFLANLMLSKWALWDSYFVSESYCLSLPFLLLSLPVLMDEEFGVRELVVASCMIILAGLSITTVGLIGFGLLWLRWIFIMSRKAKVRSLIPFMIASIIFYVLVIASLNSAMEEYHIWPLTLKLIEYSFWGNYSREAILSMHNGVPVGITVGVKAILAILMFILIHFVISWAVVFFRIKEKGWRRCINDPAAVYSLGAIGAGVFVGLLVPNSGAYYFTSVALFVSLPIIASWLVDKDWPINKSVTIPIYIILIISFSVLYSNEIYRKSFYFLKDSDHNDQLVSQLITLRKEADNKSPVVYYASLMAAPSTKYDCAAIPLIYPAVSEHAWIGLVKVDSGCLYEYRGYQDYFTDKTKTHLIYPVIPAGVKIASIQIGR